MPRWISAWRIPSLPEFKMKVAALALRVWQPGFRPAALAFMVKLHFLLFPHSFLLMIFSDGQRPAGLVKECMPHWIPAWRTSSLPGLLLMISSSGLASH